MAPSTRRAVGQFLAEPKTLKMDSQQRDGRRRKRRQFRAIHLGVWLAAFVCGASPAAPDTQSPNFQEVYDLLKTNLAGATEAELNEAAVQGLLEQLAAKVSVVGQSPRVTATNAPISAVVLERSYAYFRLSRLAAGTDQEFQVAYDGLQSTNTLKGLILDLRFTGGQDYAAAVALANRFFSTELPLVDWGEGWKKSSAKTNAIALPLAVLVNRKTTGAAEALAGILRYREVGLLLGTNTAGQASMAKEFSLKTGQRLRLAIAPVKVADGKELPFSGIKADIEVDVGPEDERAWYEDVFKPPPKSARVASVATNETNVASTNRSSRRRLNEAELVRMNREGLSPERDLLPTNAPGRIFDPPTQSVNDPVLVRALDLLKGLAVVQQFRSI